MDIVPNINKDNLSKEHEPRTRIKGKSRHRYGNLVMSLNRKGGKRGDVRVVDGGYYVCARCEKKLTNWERL